MNLERKKYFNLGLALSLLAVATIGPNISNETPSALSSVFFNTTVNCTEIGQYETRRVLLPGSWYYLDKDNKRYPDQAQKERLLAAAKYWREHKETIEAIYLLDGVANDGSNFNTEYLLQVEPTIPRSKIVVDYKSKDTHSNMAEAKGLIPPGSKVVVITHPSHLPRAVHDACIKGIKAVGVAVEVVQNSTTIINEKTKLFITALLDREGWLSTLLKKI